MTAALKRINIKRAAEHGRSVAGPWVVELDVEHFPGGRWKLYHYGHLLGTAHPVADGWILNTHPRPDHGFSRSDIAALLLFRNELGAEFAMGATPKANVRAYSKYGRSRPFPLRPEE